MSTTLSKVKDGISTMLTGHSTGKTGDRISKAELLTRLVCFSITLACAGAIALALAGILPIGAPIVAAILIVGIGTLSMTIYSAVFAFVDGYCGHADSDESKEDKKPVVEKEENKPANSTSSSLSSMGDIEKKEEEGTEEKEKENEGEGTPNGDGKPNNVIGTTSIQSSSDSSSSPNPNLSGTGSGASQPSDTNKKPEENNSNSQ